MLFSVKDLFVSYGHVEALRGVSLEVAEGQIVAMIGSNGAGKSTLLNTISALVRQQSGSIMFRGKELSRAPHAVVENGIVQVPEGRKIFGGLSVRENLQVGAYLEKNQELTAERMERMTALFPILKERIGQQAGTLSGGEQQMLAIARGLMSGPRMILLDEPSLGLSPLISREVFKMVSAINKQEGVTVLIVEQNAKKALALADYGYVLENGHITMEGKGSELLMNPDIKKAYLGERRD